MNLTVNEVLRAQATIEHILSFRPNDPVAHAEYWLNSPQAFPSHITTSYPTTQSRIDAMKDRLPKDVAAKLEKRENAGQLFESLYCAGVTFEWPIFNRDHFISDAVTAAFKESRQRMKDLKADVAALQRIANMPDISITTWNELRNKLSHLQDVVEQGPITVDSEQERLLIYAVMLDPVVAVVLNDYVLQRAKGRTKIYFLQTLCCIVYLLLNRHRWNLRNRKETDGHKHNLTVAIVKSLLKASRPTAPKVTLALVERATRTI